jgi:hypothetical protein
MNYLRDVGYTAHLERFMAKVSGHGWTWVVDIKAEPPLQIDLESHIVDPLQELLD